jgi:glycosyltransferase involved in cell wall biosynthesis
MNKHFVTIIIPAYNSEKTIGRSLETMVAQNYPLTSVIVVDSSPNELCAEICKSFPTIKYIHSNSRLLPHAARNIGVQNSSAEFYIFTDPDIYAPPDWVENMLLAYQQYGGVIIGGIANHTNRWLDWGIHLGKFDSFLPNSPTRALDFCASANMLCSKRDFEVAGPFDNKEMLGDLLISWKFTEHSIPIHFVPKAYVEHHHTQSLYSFIRERFIRGQDFGRLRVEKDHWEKRKVIHQLLATLSGGRLIKLLWREAVNTHQAGFFIKFIITFPISFVSQFFWLLGESTVYLKVITR